MAVLHLFAAALCAAPLVLSAPVAPAVAAADDYPILAGDLKSRQLMVLDPTVTDWNSSSAVKWTWAPTAGRGFSSSEVAAFNGGSDFRLRNVATGSGQRIALSDTWGLAAVISYPAGHRIWATAVPGVDNLHSVELLPNGNVAVAASGAGYIRVYAASQGANATAYGEFPLKNAHAALWDPQINRLWVGGDEPKIGPDGNPMIGSDGQPVMTGVLTTLEIAGSPAAPILREDVSRHVQLATAYTHDVSAYYHDTEKLWITTGSRAYLYDKVNETLSPAKSAGADRKSVKSIGNQPSGTVVETMIDKDKTPQGRCYTDNTASYRDWCTDTVDFFGPDTKRTRTGAAFYKARVMSPYYSAVDASLRGKVWDQTRDSTGQWVSSPMQVDGNASISRAAAAALSDGSIHLITVLPSSGLWYRVRDASGTWQSHATQIDGNGAITEAAVAGGPDGALHVFGLIPGSGIWYRKRSAVGVWDNSAQKVDTNGNLTNIAAAVDPDNTLHLFGFLPDSGIWYRKRSPAGVWDTSAQKIDDNGNLAAITAAALSDKTVHIFGLTEYGSVWHRTRSAAGTWTASSVRVPTDDTSGKVLNLSAAGSPGPRLELSTVRSGLGVWLQAQAANGSWPAATKIDDETSGLQTYAVGLPDGTLHVGKIPEIS